MPTLVPRSASLEALAHLLAVLDSAARLLREVGDDVDAYVIEAHRAQLAAGREWPGSPIESPFDTAGNPSRLLPSRP